MVRISTIYVHLLHALMKLVGLRPQAVQIEKGTVIHFWIPHRKPTYNQEKATNEPEKPSVVFLHGFALDGILTWQFQAVALAKKYAVYIPDFLFFGGSTTDRADRSMAFQVECIANGLKELGVSKCTLVGFSYGGFACFKMAEMYPDLVDSLVVSGSAMALTQSVSHDILQGIGFPSFAEFLLPRTVKGIKELLEVGSYKWPWIPDSVYTDFLEVMFDKYRKERTELLEALVIRDNDFRIPNYPQKIFLLWGEEDKIFTVEVVRSLKEQLKDKVTVRWVEKAGHLLHIERPFVFNSQLKEILASLYKDERQQ